MYIKDSSSSSSSSIKLMDNFLVFSLSRMHETSLIDQKLSIERLFY